MWWKHDEMLENFAAASGTRYTENWLPEKQ
jgi:hypothetical protein